MDATKESGGANMSTMELDIIIPVWNRPVETRSCLVDLIKNTPNARFIMVDNGSDRETESLLEEFAEILMERALFLRSGFNHGFVKALNRGLSMADAPNLMVVRSTTMVTDGWLTPVLKLAAERPEAGLIVPRLQRGMSKVAKGPFPLNPPVEISHGSFAALFLKKQLYEKIGGFDEDMDGATFCLKDYSRRAYKAGFLTFSAEGAPIYFTDESPLGSEARREDLLKRSQVMYKSRWGEEQSFCLYFPKQANFVLAKQRLDTVLRGARQGNSFTVLAHGALYRQLVKAGYARLHKNMAVDALPFLFHAEAVKKTYLQLCADQPGCRLVPAVDGIPFPGVAGVITFAELEQHINAVQLERYRP